MNIVLLHCKFEVHFEKDTWALCSYELQTLKCIEEHGGKVAAVSIDLSLDFRLF